MRYIMNFLYGVAGIGLLGCGVTHHTVEPYRSDPAAAAWLESEAERICGEMGTSAGVPEPVFVTDGCSGIPDGGKVSCCVEHDIPYWCGGSRDQRRKADRCLERCVAKRGQPVLGWLLGTGARLTAHPWVPAGWRWGYGWDYPAGYEESSPVTEPCEVPRFEPDGYSPVP